MGPRPGPTFAIADAALENAVRKSKPKKPRVRANTQNERNHMKKKTKNRHNNIIGNRLPIVVRNKYPTRLDFMT